MRHILRGKIVAGFNNIITHMKIVSKITIPNSYLEDAGAEILEIKKLIKKIIFKAVHKLIRGHAPLEELISRIC